LSAVSTYRDDLTRALVSGGERKLTLHGPVTINGMNVSMTASRRIDLYENLAILRTRGLNINDLEFLSVLVNTGRFVGLRNNNTPSCAN
jgi:hypothetical protein